MKRLFFIFFFVLQTIIAICADRYWVGGTGTWDASSTGNWSASSGGAGGASVPTSSDNVKFNGSSGSGVVTVDGNRDCLDIDFTGASVTMSLNSFASIEIYGHAVFKSGTIDMPAATGAYIGFYGTSKNITSNGATLPGFYLGSGSHTLQDDLVTSSPGQHSIIVQGSSFNANNLNVTATGIQIQATITMGSGTWTITGAFANAWQALTGCTINANTSTIRFTDTGSDGLSFVGNGKIYNNVWFDRGASGGTITITGANTFSELKNTGTAPHTMIFPNSTTTVATWSISGTAGNLITLQRTGGSGTWTISDASGTNNASYLNISNSTATGGATWNALSSTNGGGNTGWNFLGGATNKSKHFFKP